MPYYDIEALPKFHKISFDFCSVMFVLALSRYLTLYVDILFYYTDKSPIYTLKHGRKKRKHVYFTRSF